MFDTLWRTKLLKTFNFFLLAKTVSFSTLNLKFSDFLLIISLVIKGLTLDSVELK